MREVGRAQSLRGNAWPTRQLRDRRLYDDTIWFTFKRHQTISNAQKLILLEQGLLRFAGTDSKRFESRVDLDPRITEGQHLAVKKLRDFKLNSPYPFPNWNSCFFQQGTPDGSSLPHIYGLTVIPKLFPPVEFGGKYSRQGKGPGRGEDYSLQAGVALGWGRHFTLCPGQQHLLTTHRRKTRVVRSSPRDSPRGSHTLAFWFNGGSEKHPPNPQKQPASGNYWRRSNTTDTKQASISMQNLSIAPCLPYANSNWWKAGCLLAGGNPPSPTSLL